MLLKRCSIGAAEWLDIKIDDDMIADIQPTIEPEPSWNVVDVQTNLVTPGFVDCHMHLDKAFLALDTPNRSGTLAEAIDVTRERKRYFTRRDIQYRARRALEQVVEAGTTAVRTHVDIDSVIGLRSLEALLELREAYSSQIDIQLVAFPQEGLDSGSHIRELLKEALRLGADVMGGIPLQDENPASHLQEIFDLAELFCVPLDLHIDESDDPKDRTIELVIEQTLARGLQGRVTCAHCCTLATLAQPERSRVIERIAEARLNIVALPSTNLYLQGRGDLRNVRRGITPVKELLAAGVNVAFASDNLRDPFNPFGSGNLLEIGLLAAHGCHMGSPAELRQVFSMLTSSPAKILDLGLGLHQGARADLVILAAADQAQAVIERAAVQARVFGGKIRTGQFPPLPSNIDDSRAQRI